MTPATTAPESPALPCPADGVDEFLSRPSPEATAVLAQTAGPVLVLGAGGKMGLHLSLMLQRALASLGRPHALTAVSRFTTLHDLTDFTRHGIATRAADLCDPAVLAALPEAPTVFFLAGVKFGTASSPELLRRINSELPALVAERFRRARIVAFSTGCVYPFVRPETGGATEETPTAPVGEYAASCLAREVAFGAGAQAHGTRVALIRLNYSVEFRYGVLVDLAQKVLAGQPIDLTTGHVNVIWQRDALDHTIRALDLAGTPAVPVNITGADVLSVRALAIRFGELCGRPVTFTGREADTAWLNNAARSHRRFGRPPTSVEDMQRWIVAWLLQGGATWGKPTAFEQRDGKF
ncbi:MAG: NAD(P)-dependent oxidoreductase [Verrucomicrobia bacterium]|nr:NAD(P)-dependent oxidoreductase [Verrucomicrobiota bacterium]